jgi:hypothetical protein
MDGLFTESEKTELSQSLLKPSVKQDISELLTSRRYLRICANWLEFSAKVMIATGTVISVAGPSIDSGLFSRIGPGVLNVGALSSFLLCNYCKHECSERTSQLNLLLQGIGVGTFVDLESVDEDVAKCKSV